MANTLEPFAAATTHTPVTELYQGEYGWPSESDEAGTTNDAGDVPSIANLQRVLE